MTSLDEVQAAKIVQDLRDNVIVLGDLLTRRTDPVSPNLLGTVKGLQGVARLVGYLAIELSSLVKAPEQQTRLQSLAGELADLDIELKAMLEVIQRPW